MRCPFCREGETRVTDSRLCDDGMQVRRRRECTECNTRFTTYEQAELTLPRVVKRDGARMPFDENRLRAGMERALEKRPVSTVEIDRVVNEIKRAMVGLGEREVRSEQLGEWLMAALRELDAVAYVRFASVYRSFEDVQAFLEEVRRLERDDGTAPAAG